MNRVRNYITIINAGNGIAKGTTEVEESVLDDIDATKPANAEKVIASNTLENKKLGKKKADEKKTSTEETT